MSAKHTFNSRLFPAAMFNVDERDTCRGVADVALTASVNAVALK